VAPATAAAAPAGPDVAAPVAQGLPETPSREDIAAAFEKLRPDIAACTGDAHGRAVANVTIAGSGRVTYVAVEGAFAGTPAGSCIARTVRTAKFPPFSSVNMKVSYPMAL
jgi:hypothetical protein